jgi:NADH dehydrogenase [ubiquinone] 1 alpha subcomplex assembly factor 7
MSGPEAPDTLSEIFARLIASTGPISLQYYMGECNARYYASRDPLGAPAPGSDKGGDFVTAPEISQMFGELIGLWLADLWIRSGRHAPVHYVELGPGRGTLARDALRAARQHGLEPRVHLVEGSAVLKSLQIAAVPEAEWHHDLSSVPRSGPILLVANEFLDALPIRQLVKTAEGWRERMVGFEGGRLIPVAGQRPMDAAVPEEQREAEPGTIIETCPGAAAIVYETAGRLAEQGGAALFIDYGHDAPRFGSTFQAVRRHQMVDPFTTPGEADLTAHVDFRTLTRVAESRGAKCYGVAGQGDFLRALGIDLRAQALGQAAPDQAGAIEIAKRRLTAPEQMGALFKVMGLAAPNWPDAAGFQKPAP